MAKFLATYIALPGTTGEAFEHWHDVFGGQLNLMRYGDAPAMEGMGFEPDPNAVAHVTLTLPFGVLAGGDSMDPEHDYPVRDTAYSLLIETDSADEARGYQQKLLDAGGQVGMPFEKAPWGGWYGQVFDRFGVMWAFSAE
ncbi:VOC family protein [Propionimicrobium sp. PCR01-08-3]|uniref:VOC family protein n=1 Tax=Propionimicrobium sp. PCR01-08-3 TaxID=3052086 RepID=UPI00255C335E|nr:VOC family protein [Propionimicrobium sp. PCR01-08-3]WIY82049.1 VOC family protein [Propionimicrobium sp. PCR01-08-3]